MKILAITTSTANGGIGIFKDQKRLFVDRWKKEKSHSDQIILSLEKNIKFNGGDLNDINAIAIDKGPGSFTGLRISANVAKSLAYVLNINIIPVDSLRILAQSVGKCEEPILCLINAFRNLLYGAIYKYQKIKYQKENDFEKKSILINVLPPQILSINQLSDIIKENPACGYICAGDGLKIYKDQIDQSIKKKIDYREEILFPELENLGCLNFQEFSLPMDWKTYLPLYIRNLETEYKLRNKNNIKK